MVGDKISIIIKCIIIRAVKALFFLTRVNLLTHQRVN